MSEVSKVVFAAFTQHCIQSNVTHVGGVEGVKYFTEQKKVYSIYSGLLSLQDQRPVQPSVLRVSGSKSV